MTKIKDDSKIIHLKNFNAEVLCGNNRFIVYVIDTYEGVCIKSILGTKYVKCSFDVANGFISKNNLLVINGDDQGLLINLEGWTFIEVYEDGYNINSLTSSGGLLFSDNKNFYTIPIDDYIKNIESYVTYPKKSAKYYYPVTKVYGYIKNDIYTYKKQKTEISSERELLNVDDKFFVSYVGIDLHIYNSDLLFIKKFLVPLSPNAYIINCYLDKNNICVWFLEQDEQEDGVTTSKLYTIII